MRVVIGGEAGSGKSDLIRFLVGENPIPSGLAANDLPPVILRFGETRKTSAGWWDGNRKVFDGISIEAAAAETPDYIALHVPNPFLKRINLFDLSGTRNSVRLQEQFLSVARHAEIVLWCTEASRGWSEDESALWYRMPSQLADASLLVVTHTGAVQDKVMLSRALHRLKTKAAPLFHDMLPLATNRAIDAAPGGQVANMDDWAESGGKSLISSILYLAKSVRQAEKNRKPSDMDNAAALRKAFADWKPGTPANQGQRPRAGGSGLVNAQPFGRTRAQSQEQVAQAPVQTMMPLAEILPDVEIHADVFADMPLPSSTPAAPAAPSATPEKQSTLLSYIYEQSDRLIELIGTEDEFDEPEFLNICMQTLDEFSYRLSDTQLRENAGWVEEQVQEAAELLILLQLEGGDQSLHDAATIMLQLSRDLAWAIAA